MIELRGICVRGAEAGEPGGVDLCLEPGEAVAVLGSAGAGKSRLAAIAAARARPDGGSATLFGSDPAALRGSVLARLRREIGFVDDAPAFFEDERTVDNVGLPLWLAGDPIREVTRAAERALFEVGLEEETSAPARTLSQGMRRRAALARALVAEPRAVIADDLLAGLDAGAAAYALSALERARERGAAVLALSAEPRLASGARRLGWTTYELERGGLAMRLERSLRASAPSIRRRAASAASAAFASGAGAPRSKQNAPRRPFRGESSGWAAAGPGEGARYGEERSGAEGVAPWEETSPTAPAASLGIEEEPDESPPALRDSLDRPMSASEGVAGRPE